MIMPMLVRCTQCGREGRVPDQLVRQRVRCPKCGAEFVAADTANDKPQPKPSDDKPAPKVRTEAVEAEILAADPLETDDGRDRNDDLAADEELDAEAEERRRRKRSARRRAAAALKGPGVCFIAVGAIGFLVSSTILAMQLAGYHPGLEQPEKGKPIRPAPGQLAPPVPHNEPNDARTIGYFLGLTLSLAVGFTWALIVGIAGMQMLRLRHFGFVYVASIVTMLPCNVGCCFGVPIGIWSLAVLSRPEVRKAFSV